MFRRALWPICMLALGGGALAPTVRANADEFTIDANRTIVQFEMRSLGAAQLGEFSQVAGSVALDPQTGAGKIDVLVDARSLELGNKIVEKVARGAAMLNVDAHPEIVYRAQHIEFVEGQPARIEGELTIRGITQNVALDVARYDCRYESQQERCAIVAAATFRRSAFGMTRYMLLANDEVTLAIRAEGVRQAT